MAKQGLSYASPLSAQTDPRWGRRASTTQAGSAEIHVALADAACQQTTNLLGTYKALEAAYQQAFLNTNKAQLQAALKVFHGWAANAKAILTAQ